MAAADGGEAGGLLQCEVAPAPDRSGEGAQLAALQRQVLQLRRFVAGSVLLSTVSVIALAAVVAQGRGGGGSVGGDTGAANPILQHAALSIHTGAANPLLQQSAFSQKFSLPGSVGVGETVSAAGLGLAGSSAPHPALLQRWTGPDNVIVPYGFSGCDTTSFPPQIAPVRRAGDFLFLSGILGYKQVCQDAEPDPDKQIELAFHWADVALQAAGSDWAEVMAVTSYHLSLSQGKDTFIAMRAKYLAKPPFPAWTAVAVNELYFTNEIYEMTLIALRKPCTGLECDR